MTLTYQWEIIGMKKTPSLDGLSDVVISVDYKYTGTDSDSGHSGDYYGHTAISAPDSENFVALGNLTEAQVSTWVEAILSTQPGSGSSSKLETMKTLITNDINKKITPTEVDVEQLPWAPAEDEGEP